MEKLVAFVAEKASISTEQAEVAVNTVVDALIANLPEETARQIEGLLADARTEFGLVGN